MGSGLSVVVTNDINDINDINGTTNDTIEMHRFMATKTKATTTTTTISVDDMIQTPSLSIAMLRELSSSSSSSSSSSLEVDNVVTIETMDDIDEYLGNDDSNGNDDGARYMLSVDCLDAESSLMLIQRVAALQRVTGISAASNKLIDENGINSIKDIDLHYIQTLNLSNNTTIRSVKTLSLSLSQLPLLLVLDLSYCSLHLTSLCFYPLVSLQKLTMDGCGISDTLVAASSTDDGDGTSTTVTTVTRGVGYFDSIFSGLINMQELSLKENELGSSSSLRGLGYYSLLGVDSVLRSLWIDDNPLCESSKAFSSSVSMLINDITSLQTVNDKNYRTTTTTTAAAIDVVALLRKGDQRIDRGSSSSSSSSGLDNMEKEYLSALKGERETTVVA